MQEILKQAKAKARGLARKAVAWAKPRLSALWAKSKAVGMSAAVAMSLTLPALATSGGSGSDLTTVVSATDTITSMVGKVWTVLLANPLLTVYVAAGLLGTGIGFFKSLRQAAHG